MTTLPSLHPVSAPSMPRSTAILVLAQARSLQRAARSGRTPPLLKGRRFGLVCEAPDGIEAQRFQRAARELGAQVAHLRPVLDAHSSAQDVSDTARLLGRLYDAVECQGMDARLVRQVAEDAGVPVYDGLASSSHPSAQLAELLDDDSPAEDKRRFVLQALLLNAVA